MLSFTEENYLKAIYKIHERTKSAASTNAIAEIMKTTAASVTDMMRKLAQKEMIQYEKYKGCLLYTSPSPRDKRQSRMPSSA